MTNLKKVFEVESNGNIWIKTIDNNISIRKPKQFSKRYNYNDMYQTFPLERKAIASNFLSLYKDTKDMFYYYQYLVYSNRYNDFGKVLLNIDNSLDNNLVNLTNNVIKFNNF